MSDPEADRARLRAEFPKPHEAFAAWVVERVLGARVSRTDRHGAPPGTVDGEITYPNNRTAVVEFTSVEPQPVWHLSGRLRDMPPTPAPGRLTWWIHPRDVDELERLEPIYERVIALCEQHGANHPSLLPFEVVTADPELSWIVWEAQVAMFGFERAGDPIVRWAEPAITAIMGNPAEAISTALATALRVEPCPRHIAKLLRDPNPERHLFLSVGLTGLSTTAAFALADSDADVLPALDPELPEGIDHLWLASDWGKSATIWTRGRGWRIELLSD